MNEVIVLKSKNDEIPGPLMKELQIGFHPELIFLVSDDQEMLAQLALFAKDYLQLNRQQRFTFAKALFVTSQPLTRMKQLN
jgi:hypothetical protein